MESEEQRAKRLLARLAKEQEARALLEGSVRELRWFARRRAIVALVVLQLVALGLALMGLVADDPALAKWFYFLALLPLAQIGFALAVNAWRTSRVALANHMLADLDATDRAADDGPPRASAAS